CKALCSWPVCSVRCVPALGFAASCETEPGTGRRDEGCFSVGTHAAGMHLSTRDTVRRDLVAAVQAGFDDSRKSETDIGVDGECGADAKFCKNVQHAKHTNPQAVLPCG